MNGNVSQPVNSWSLRGAHKMHEDEATGLADGTFCRWKSKLIDAMETGVPYTNVEESLRKGCKQPA